MTTPDPTPAAPTNPGTLDAPPVNATQQVVDAPAPGGIPPMPPPIAASLRPPAPECPGNGRAVWMGDSWACTAG